MKNDNKTREDKVSANQTAQLDEHLIQAVDCIMDFCNPTEDRGQWLAFALKEPRQMFVHSHLFSMFAGDKASDERWIEEHTPHYPIAWLRRRWQSKKRTEIAIKHAEWTSKFLTAAIGAMNVTCGVLGLPWQDPNKALDLFIVVGNGDADGKIDVGNLGHSEPIMHLVVRGGHIISVKRYDAEFEQMLADFDRADKLAEEKERIRVAMLKANGNPLAGTEYEGLLS